MVLAIFLHNTCINPSLTLAAVNADVQLWCCSLATSCSGGLDLMGYSLGIGHRQGNQGFTLGKCVKPWWECRSFSKGQVQSLYPAGALGKLFLAYENVMGSGNPSLLYSAYLFYNYSSIVVCFLVSCFCILDKT